MVNTNHLDTLKYIRSYLHRKEERCFGCDEPTGRAGKDDDSLYDSLGAGPYCEECWDFLFPVSEVPHI